MASRKQRRRREKLQRHEYEYVLETEDGEEVPLASPRAVDAAQNGKAKPADEAPLDRRGRPVQKPSLLRVLRRSAIFAPLIAIFLYYYEDEITVAQLAFNVVFLLALFMAFSYLVDAFVYRTLLRRQGRLDSGRRPR